MVEEVEKEQIISLEDDEDKKEQLNLEDVDKTPILAEEKKLNIALIVVIFLLIIALFTLLALYLLKKDEKRIISPKPDNDTNVSTIVKNLTTKKEGFIPKTKIDRLTQKAKELYESGQQDKAMAIYKEISFFQKSLSSFNLGVTHYKAKKYKDAIKNFQDAFNYDDLKFESALNIALCYKALKDKVQFQKYIDLADEYLMSKYDSALFDYYKSLIFYYKNQPIESLVMLYHDKRDYFKNKRNSLFAKDLILVKNYDKAIDKLFKTDNPDNYLIGTLYARIGEYSLAAGAFNNAIKSGQNPLNSLIALSLVENKLGLFESCASSLKSAINKFEDNATKVLPIKAKIKESLYDPIKAQMNFKKSIFNNKENLFEFVFYFAPYKLFNPKQSNKIIYKGAREIYVNDISSASSYLNQAKAISQINIEIVKGIKLINQHKIYEANKLFKNILDKYPNHSVLHYDLALTYANMSDFQNAKKHFEKSFLLDNKNYLSAFFVAYTKVLLNKDYDDTILQNLLKYPTEYKKHQLKLLYAILKSNSSVNVSQKLINPFDIVLNIIIANLKKDNVRYKELTANLIKLLPKDLVANIIYTDAISQNKSIKEYAKNIQMYLINKSLNLSPLIYGETFPRELYITMLNIAGSTNYIKNLLLNEYKTDKNQIALLQSLAYTYIYTREYEKAYRLYNILIDNYKQDYPHNLFLGAVSAIGSNHHANAVALLELANLDDNLLYESRYTLGLLYQESHNLKAAAIQYLKIGNNGFESKYIDFDLVH